MNGRLELPRTRTSHFSDDLPLLWIEGRNLLADEAVWIPYEMVQLNMTLPAPTGMGCFLGGSNGLASGNHILEAISHALCEVIERDASTMFGLLDVEEQDARRHGEDDSDPEDRGLHEARVDALQLRCVAVLRRAADGAPEVGPGEYEEERGDDDEHEPDQEADGARRRRVHAPEQRGRGKASEIARERPAEHDHHDRGSHTHGLVDAEQLLAAHVGVQGHPQQRHQHEQLAPGTPGVLGGLERQAARPGGRIGQMRSS